jgi:hypothetical protein
MSFAIKPTGVALVLSYEAFLTTANGSTKLALPSRNACCVIKLVVQYFDSFSNSIFWRPESQGNAGITKARGTG